MQEKTQGYNGLIALNIFYHFISDISKTHAAVISTIKYRRIICLVRSSYSASCSWLIRKTFLAKVFIKSFSLLVIYLPSAASIRALHTFSLRIISPGSVGVSLVGLILPLIR